VNELRVSTEEEYVKSTTRRVMVTSDNVFEVKALDAESTVVLLDMLPEEEIAERREMIRFVARNLVKIRDGIVCPNILAPKVSPERLTVLDLTDLLMEMMDLTGIIETETVDEEEDRADA